VIFAYPAVLPGCDEDIAVDEYSLPAFFGCLLLEATQAFATDHMHLDELPY